jgi:hypothetical protein
LKRLFVRGLPDKKKLKFLNGNALRFQEGSHYSEGSASGDYTIDYKVKSGKVKKIILGKSLGHSGDCSLKNIKLIPITNKAYVLVKRHVWAKEGDYEIVDRIYRVFLHKSKDKKGKIIDLSNKI